MTELGMLFKTTHKEILKLKQEIFLETKKLIYTTKDLSSPILQWHNYQTVGMKYLNLAQLITTKIAILRF